MTYTLTDREGTLPDVKARPFILRCTEPECVYLVSVLDAAEAELRISQHHCPHKGGPTRVGLLVSRTILEHAWDKIDAALIELLEGNYPPVHIPDAEPFENPEKVRLKGVLRGMAEVLALFMTPYLPHPDNIAAEAKKRYDAKKAGITDYETPGLGHRRMDGAVSGKVEGNHGYNRPAAQSAIEKAASRVGDKEKAAIKHAMKSGMFQASDVAKTYGVTAAVIELIVSQS